MTELISSLVIPGVVCAVGCILLFGRGNGFSSFTLGAKEGLRSAVGLLPTLIALVVAVKMLNASGAVELICRVIEPAASAVGIPSGLLPLLLTRPVSGSASTAVYSSLLTEYGADSLEAFCASIIMGSSDTMIYVITVYFSSVGVRRTRYAFPCAAVVMIFVVFFSCFLGRLFFA